jgi:hypothetical protein
MQGSRGIFWLAEASEWMLLETRPCRMAESPARQGGAGLRRAAVFTGPKPFIILGHVRFVHRESYQILNG